MGEYLDTYKCSCVVLSQENRDVHVCPYSTYIEDRYDSETLVTFGAIRVCSTIRHLTSCATLGTVGSVLST